MIRKIIKALWIFLAVIVLAIVIVFVSISKGWIGYMPPVEELENPSYKFATEIFSEDEKVLGTWSYSKENRVYTAYKDLSPSIINALIATEDVRFVEHSGIDAKALFRAFVKRGLMFQKNAGGGSTLSQQLAKQLFTENVARNTLQRLFQKPIEWVIAVKLERYYTKEEILSMYLNKFDFLNNAVGIKTAAYTYFGCEPKDLTSFGSQMNTVYDQGSWWSEAGDAADVVTPRWLSKVSGYSNGTQYYYDGSYIRLKNAEIAYTFTDGWVRKLGVKNLKIYLNGNNLWVWSKMPDDRESNFAGSGNQGAYPTVKRFNLGVKFTL